MTCPACGARFGDPSGEGGDAEVDALDDHLDAHL